MTNNLERRIKEHYKNRGGGNTFAGKYFCYKLIYFEMFLTPLAAIRREKEIKKLNRTEKFELIKSKNPYLGFLPLRSFLETYCIEKIIRLFHRTFFRASLLLFHLPNIHRKSSFYRSRRLELSQ